jgi:hypothetical protein
MPSCASRFSRSNCPTARIASRLAAQQQLSAGQRRRALELVTGLAVAKFKSKSLEEAASNVLE